MRKKYSLTFVVSLCFIMSVYGQIITFDFDGLAGNEATAISNFNDANLSVSTISRGAGLNPGLNGNRFNATGWAATNIANAVAGDDYMEFTITPNATYEFDVTTIDVNFQRSGTGPRGIALRSSLDGYAANIDTEKVIVDSGAVQTFTFTVNQTGNATAVTYRVYGWAEAGGGTGGFEGTGDDIIVNGSVNLACTPTHSLTSFAPTEGPIGTVVTIVGDDFSNSTSVDFNGTTSTNVIYLDTDADGIIDTLLAEVPTGTTTGDIVITEAGCTLTSASPFTVIDTSGGCSGNLSDLIMTEIYDNNGLALGYIEIYNGTGANINLADYYIRRYGDNADFIANNFTDYSFGVATINDGETLFGRLSTSANVAGITPDFQYGNSSGINEEDIFELRNSSGVIDVYIVTAAAAGYYAQRNTNTAGPNATSNPGDWTENPQSNNGTPDSSTAPETMDLGTFNYSGSTATYPSATDPSDVIGSCLTSASFTSNGTASAGGAITYQWYFNDGTNTAWSIVNAINLPLTTVTGTTNSTLTLSGGLYNYDNYQFYCEVTEDGTCGTISNAAQLRIGTATWDGTNWIWNNGTAINTPPSLASNVVLNDDFNTSIGGLQQSFSACNLTVSDNVSLFIDNDDYVEVQNDLVVNNTTAGGINIEPRGAFVQINDNGLVSADDPEDLTVNKLTAPANNWYEYTYWSSPVANETIGDALLPSNANRRYWFNAQNYLDEYAEVGNNNATGPGNEGQDDIDDDGNDWQQITNVSTINNSSFLEPGIGYAATHDPAAFNCTPGPGCPDPRPGVRYTFSGLFNNGIVEPSIYRNDLERNDNNWNLIGNPYPSAIDVDEFFAVNFYSTTNPNGSASGTIEGVVYMWSHNSPPDATNNGNEDLNFLASDYVVINGLGTVTPTEEQGTGETLPNRFIPSGQAFFVAMSDDGGPAYNMPSPATETDIVVFNNAMRVTGNNNQFFRNASQPNLDNKLWVNLTSDNGIFSQILVGYTDGATDDFDGAYYDAYRNLSNEVYSGIYSLINNHEKQFAIQGKNANSLTLDEVIPLGFYTAIEEPTIYTLSISQREGSFMNSNTIYLIDRLDNSIHELSTSDYSFISETGEFNNRFEIVFTPEALSINDNIIDSSELTITELTDGNVKFKVGSQFTINQIEILDLLGRQVYLLQGNNSTEVFNLSRLSSTAYIAKVTLSNGQIINKKAIKQ